MNLTGKKTLLLENEALVAIEAESILTSLGAAEIITVKTEDEARSRLADANGVDLVIVDWMQGRAETCADLINMLIARALPFLVTITHRGLLPDELVYLSDRIVEKPYSGQDLLRAVRNI